MNIYLTLDYELFMGAQSGSVQNCLIKPMNRLIERTKDYGQTVINAKNHGAFLYLGRCRAVSGHTS